MRGLLRLDFEDETILVPDEEPSLDLPVRIMGSVEPGSERVPLPIGKAEPDVMDRSSTGNRGMLHFGHFDEFNHGVITPVSEHGPFPSLPDWIVLDRAQRKTDQVHIKRNGAVQIRRHHGRMIEANGRCSRLDRPICIRRWRCHCFRKSGEAVSDDVRTRSRRGPRRARMTRRRSPGASSSCRDPAGSVPEPPPTP